MTEWIRPLTLLALCGVLASCSDNDADEAPAADPAGAEARPEDGGERAGKAGKAGKRARSDKADAAGDADTTRSKGDAADASTDAAADAEPGVLLFAIGVHIEPFGLKRGGAGARGEGGGGGGPMGGASKGKGKGGNKKSSKDYNDHQFYKMHADAIRSLASMVESHGGKLTVQGEDPFISTSKTLKDTLFKDLVASGHGIGLHFHEDAHLGKSCDTLEVDTWCTELKRQASIIADLSGEKVRYLSGGALYPGLVTAADCAGIEVLSEWKNRTNQSNDPLLVGVHPWRPAGGPDASNMTKFAKHDPKGPVIFLPEGTGKGLGSGGAERSRGPEGDTAFFETFAEGLHASVDAARADRVNVFNLTIHPTEFGERGGGYPALEAFLTEHVDPLVKSGKVQWATFPEMGDAYKQWEKSAEDAANPRLAEGPGRD